MDKLLRWGLLATGHIARRFATALPKSQTGVLASVASRDLKKAKAFGKEFGCQRCYGSYQELLADGEVDAVYISTPHPMHAQWAVAAASAGKHILCEKPIAMNHTQAAQIVAAARSNDVFLMEAFMYRCHPQIARLVKLLRAGTIGQVRVIRAAFSFRSKFNPKSRLFAKELGGGAILDIGCYTASMARLVAGVAMGGEFADPVEVKAAGHIGKTGVDEWSVCVMKFPGDIVADVSAGVSVSQESTVRIYGDDGVISLPDPWTPAREGGSVKILIQKSGKTREIEIKTSEYLYAFEADVVARSIKKRQASFPAMTWDDTLGNMRALDMWRESIGLTYDCD